MMSGMQELCTMIYAKFRSRLFRIITTTNETTLYTQYTQELLDDLHPYKRAAVLQAAFASNLPIDDLVRKAGMRPEPIE